MEKESKKNRNRKKNLNKGKLKYGAGVISLFGLIAAALWLPQVFFEVQDNFRYGELSLLRQEQMDILTLSTRYEASLYRRLANFAQGLAEQRRYYVDEQSREVTDEIRAFLRSDDGPYHNILVEIFESILEPKESIAAASVIQWKQYLIYSDDYAQGVNFILWFFELVTPEGYRTFLLMDAQDHTVYAIKIMGSEAAKRMQSEVIVASSYFPQRNMALWSALNICYDVLTTDFASFMEGLVYDMMDKGFRYQASWQGATTDTAGNEIKFQMLDDESALCMEDGRAWYGKEEDGSMYYLLPFQGNQLTFIINPRPKIIYTPDAAIGIREIYELIPEFQELG